MAEDTEYFEEKMNATFGSPEGKEQPIRNALRGAFWGALFLAFVAMMIWMAEAFAVTIPLHVLEKDEVTMRLMGTPCVDPVSARIGLNLPPELYGKLQAIESTWLMKDGTRQFFPGCWVEVDAKLAGEDGYFVIFSDGTYGVVPKGDFLKTKGSVGV